MYQYILVPIIIFLFKSTLWNTDFQVLVNHTITIRLCYPSKQFLKYKNIFILLTTDECENTTNNSNIKSIVQEEEHQNADENNQKQKKSASFSDKKYDTEIDHLIKRRKEQLMKTEEMCHSPVNYPPPMPPHSFVGSELNHPSSHYSPYQASSSCSSRPNGTNSEDSLKC